MKRYYVLSNGESPSKIFFDKASAIALEVSDNGTYMDVFDEQGELVESWKYKMVGDSFKNGYWTTKF